MSHYPKEGPWELPEGWAWCRLDELGEVITGTTPSKGDTSNYGNDYPFYKPTDLENGINTTLAGDNLSAEGYEKARKLPINSVLVTCIGATIGKTGLIRRAGSCNQQINAVIPLPFVVPEYLYYCCVSGYGQDAIISNASATTLPILNKSRFSELLFPLPPIQEQQRILEAINHYMAIIEGVDDKRIKLIKLSDASKTKILDLAIHGKLVPQDHSDEPAIELLKRINPNFKPSDNLHYDEALPSGWAITPLYIICDTINGLWKGKKEPLINVGVIRNANFTKDFTLDYSKIEYIDVEQKSFEKRNLENGDIIVEKSGGSDNFPVGRSILYRGENGKYSFSNFTMSLRIAKKDCILPEYLYYVLQYRYRRGDMKQLQTQTTGLHNLLTDKFMSLTIPIPPVEEQLRIVQTIKNLFGIVNGIRDLVNDNKQGINSL